MTKKQKLFYFLSALFFLSLLSLQIAPHSLATTTTVHPEPVLTGGTITEFLQQVMLHIQGIIAFLSVLFIAIGGALFIMSGGNQAMATAARVCIVGAILGLALAAAGPSFLRQIMIIVYGSPTAVIPTNIDAAPTMAEITQGALSFLLSVIGMLAIIGLTVSSILYLTSGGNSSRAEQAKSAMKYSVIGIIAAGASLILVKQIVSFF